MIDRDARDDLAQHLRWLVTGRITNDEFDDRYIEMWAFCDDPAVRAIAEFGWSLHSGTHAYDLTGQDAAPKEIRRLVAQVILFLQSDQEYEWSVELPGGAVLCRWLLGTGLFVAGFLTSGLCKLFGVVVELLMLAWSLGRRLVPDEEPESEDRSSEEGDTEVWPFFRVPDLEDAKKRPRFLVGRQAA